MGAGGRATGESPPSLKQRSLKARVACATAWQIFRNGKPGKIWSAQSESIRTAFEIPFEVDLYDEKDVALYVKISEKVSHLQRLGMTYRQIGEQLGMSRWLCRKAGQYVKDREKEWRNS